MKLRVLLLVLLGLALIGGYQRIHLTEALVMCPPVQTGCSQWATYSIEQRYVGAQDWQKILVDGKTPVAGQCLTFLAAALPSVRACCTTDMEQSCVDVFDHPVYDTFTCEEMYDSRNSRKYSDDEVSTWNAGHGGQTPG